MKIKTKLYIIIITNYLPNYKFSRTENGEITSSGSFKDLQKTSTSFKKMVELQEL